jgi:hypothetical protein
MSVKECTGKFKDEKNNVHHRPMGEDEITIFHMEIMKQLKRLNDTGLMN